jgi:diguanylate cyclase (GGDEF)-like protein
LLTRRGFHTLAESQLKAARRTGLGSILIYGDLDGLKAINDTLGHQTGSDAIIAMSEVMRRTFRESDLLARMGGDEFVILVTNVTPAHGPMILDRFQVCLSDYIRETDPSFPLAISTGATYVEPDTKKGIGELTVIADQAMYQCKRLRRSCALSGRALPPYIYHSFLPELLDQSHEVATSRR